MESILAIYKNCIDEEKLNDFIIKHKHKNKSVGAIGGKYSYIVTETGIAPHIVIQCNICNKKLDISDYESW